MRPLVEVGTTLTSDGSVAEIGEVAAREIDDEAARARRHHLVRAERARLGLEGLAAPGRRATGATRLRLAVMRIAERDRLARLDRLVRNPGRHDIVVGLVGGRQFDEFDPARRPSCPSARSSSSGAARRRGRGPGSPRRRGRAAAARSPAMSLSRKAETSGCGRVAQRAARSIRRCPNGSADRPNRAVRAGSRRRSAGRSGS